MPGPRRRIYAAAACFDLCAFLFLGTLYLRLPEITGTRAGALESELNGWIQGLAAGGYALLVLWTGRRSDFRSRTASCRAGALLAAGFAVVAALVRQPLPLAAAAVALWSSRSLFWPSLQAALGDATEAARRGGAIAVLNVSWSTGKAAGFLLAGAVVEYAGTRRALLLAAFVAAVVALVVPPLPAGTPAAESRSPVSAPRNRFLGAAWLANFAAFGVGNVLASQLPVVGRSLSERAGAIDGQLFALYAAQTASFLFLVRWQGWIGRRWPFVAAALAVAVPTALGPLLVSPFARGAALAVVGLGFGFSYQASLTYSLARPWGRGARAGTHEAVLGAGACLVPLAAGLVARAAQSTHAAFVFAAAVGACALVGELLLLRNPRGAETPAGPPGPP